MRIGQGNANEPKSIPVYVRRDRPCAESWVAGGSPTEWDRMSQPRGRAWSNNAASDVSEAASAGSLDMTSVSHATLPSLGGSTPPAGGLALRGNAERDREARERVSVVLGVRSTRPPPPPPPPLSQHALRPSPLAQLGSRSQDPWTALRRKGPS